MKKKLGDLTLNEIKALLSKCGDINCENCIFENIHCGYGNINGIELGGLDLDQEIEVEEND